LTEELDQIQYLEFRMGKEIIINITLLVAAEVRFELKNLIEKPGACEI